MKLNGSDILMECLLEQGVDTIFGYPGGAVLHIYDAIYRYQDRLRHILTAHEQGAAHAADGYARATGKVGVCLATSGPGATNLVTGIATAYMDSSPVVAITGNVAKPLLGKDSFQEIDITGVTLPITKHNFIVDKVEDLADTVRRAFYIAQEGRPGPVLIDITKDATAAITEYQPQTPAPVEQRTSIQESELAAALALIKASKRPLILAGGGLISSGAQEAFARFAETIDAPVALTIMGLGGFPADHPRFTGMIGMHGVRVSNLAAMSCDLLIAMGVRFSDRVTGDTAAFAEQAKILHIDIDPAEIHKNIRADGAVIGDLDAVLERLTAALKPQRHVEWMAEVAQLKATYPPPPTGRTAELCPQLVMEKIAGMTGGEAIIVTDVGQHQMFACQRIPHLRPRHLITSGGLGTMGFGLGASIGAAAGQPDKKVVLITGDGCFRMNCIELATAVSANLPVVVVVINNHVLGMVRQWQNFFHGQRYSHTTFAPSERGVDFARLAEAYYVTAFNVKSASELEPALAAAFALGKPAVVNVELGPDDKIFPMVPAGGRIDDFWDEA